MSLAAGYIGSHMVLDPLDVGEDVIVLDNLSTGFRSAVPDEAKFVEGDIGDHNLVRPILLRNPVDAII
ncbi:MAG: NAD-dependent epimerase/dehydratase family protein, partial [Methyloceanibacter sp.]